LVKVLQIYVICAFKSAVDTDLVFWNVQTIENVNTKKIFLQLPKIVTVRRKKRP